MENNLTLKTYMAVMAERDAAIRERNVAMEERRQALAERDMAMTQRDSALAERNTALEERDKALTALEFRESPTNEYEPGLGVSHELEYMYNHHHHQQQQQQQLNDDEDTAPYSPEPYTTAKKIRKGKEVKEKGVIGARSKKKGIKRGSDEMMNNQVLTTESTSDIWDSVDFGDDDGEDLEQHFAAWNENSTGLKEEEEEEEGGYEDEFAVPVCSCGGAPQPCYRMGNGGWQSVCCVSMFHLQHHSNKRQAGGILGRKMSGGAFAKLMQRVMAGGHDPSVPLDLKDYWDQYETPK